jgi:hypothetical protein
MIAKAVAMERVGWQSAFLLLCSCAPTVSVRQDAPAPTEQRMANVRLEGTAACFDLGLGGSLAAYFVPRHLQSVVDEYAERLRHEPDKAAILAEMQGKLDTWHTIEVVDDTLRVTKRPVSACLGGIEVAEAKIW